MMHISEIGMFKILCEIGPLSLCDNEVRDVPGLFRVGCLQEDSTRVPIIT